MKVGELIKKLEKLDKNKEIYLIWEDYMEDELTEIIGGILTAKEYNAKFGGHMEKFLRENPKVKEGYVIF